MSPIKFHQLGENHQNKGWPVSGRRRVAGGGQLKKLLVAAVVIKVIKVVIKVVNTESTSAIEMLLFNLLNLSEQNNECGLSILTLGKLKIGWMGI